MADIQTIAPETMSALAGFSTCVLSNAIEQFNIRPRNEGFMNSSVQCQFPRWKPKIGYAVTGRIRTSSTPMSKRCYYEAMDWWSYLVTIPAPRFVVLADLDQVPGVGAFVGEIHATIATALECTACVTNGAVRDLPGVEASGLQVFAGNISVSHAYAHVIDFGEPVEIGGLVVRPGDLLHGDQHGVHSIPASIAKDLPKKAEEMLTYEGELIEFCRSSQFSLGGLSDRIDHRPRSC